MSDFYDDSPSVAGSSLEAEYDAAFDGDERASNFLKLTSDAFSLKFEKIDVKTIAVFEHLKMGRKKTISGLTATIHDLNVLNPIQVMTVEEEDDEFKYILLKGLRRLYAAIKNGIEEVNAIVWNFDDKELGKDNALYLSLILGRTQRRSWDEIWELYQLLELKSDITPGSLEYLLQLEPGEAMRLKDVMLCDYEEVKLALTSGEKTLDACYKMLTKLRKEEDRLEQDDLTGVNDVEGTDGLAGNGNDAVPQLSDSDVRELLDMADDLDSDDDLSEEDFDSMNQSSFGDEQQKVGERHPLDPALRQAVLARDKFICKCCGMKLIGARLGLIAVHHVIPVHCKGKDTLDNLITLCLNDHINLHIMERNGGSIMMSQNDFDDLSENEQLSLKKALKLARIAIEADKRRGMSKEDIVKATQDSIRHPMPGKGLKENQIIYATTKNNNKDDSNDEDDEE